MVVGSRFVRSLRGYSAAYAAVPVPPKPRRNEAVVVGWLLGYLDVFGGSGGRKPLLKKEEGERRKEEVRPGFRTRNPAPEFTGAYASAAACVAEVVSG